MWTATVWPTMRSEFSFSNIVSCSILNSSQEGKRSKYVVKREEYRCARRLITSLAWRSRDVVEACATNSCRPLQYSVFVNNTGSPMFANETGMLILVGS